MGLHDDGRLILVEQNGAALCSALDRVRKRAFETLLETDSAIDLLRPRPHGNALFYRKDGKFWLYDYEKRAEREIHTDPGDGIPCFFWSADGKSLVYLCAPEGGRGVQLREHFPDSGEDKLICPTSQFANFAANRNGLCLPASAAARFRPTFCCCCASRGGSYPGRPPGRFPCGCGHLLHPRQPADLLPRNRSGKCCIYGIPADKLVEPTDT